MTINFLGTWEQKENETGNTGTKAYFREQGIPKSKKYFQRTLEHGENFVGSKGTCTPPGAPLWRIADLPSLS